MRAGGFGKGCAACRAVRGVRGVARGVRVEFSALWALFLPQHSKIAFSILFEAVFGFFNVGKDAGHPIQDPSGGMGEGGKDPPGGVVTGGE